MECTVAWDVLISKRVFLLGLLVEDYFWSTELAMGWSISTGYGESVGGPWRLAGLWSTVTHPGGGGGESYPQRTQTHLLLTVFFPVSPYWTQPSSPLDHPSPFTSPSPEVYLPQGITCLASAIAISWITSLGEIKILSGAHYKAYQMVELGLVSRGTTRLEPPSPPSRLPAAR